MSTKTRQTNSDFLIDLRAAEKEARAAGDWDRVDRICLSIDAVRQDMHDRGRWLPGFDRQGRPCRMFVPAQ